MEFGDRIARRMKLHDLSILMAVAQAGSMNKAAVFLNKTQGCDSK
jgi:DNA-binding transcriptional LysR family regulator